MIAALFVQADGVYADLPDVDVWGIMRDARRYPGPHPVVAHPDCKRWGRFFHGSPRAPHRFKLGDDAGCFEAALRAVRIHGGVLEHPEGSHAWRAFSLMAPFRLGGWLGPDRFGGFTCCVEQGFYGHVARKRSWLYAVRTDMPTLNWGAGFQRLDPVVLERHGYEHARRQGMISRIGGKEKERFRDQTPLPFRDLLLSLARSVPT